MWIAETIDLNNHDSVVKFIKNQSDKIKKLEEENEQLKEQLKIYKNDGLETLNDLERVYENNKKALSNIEQLDKENRELKKQMNRLYNYFMDWHSDEMGGNQFSEMWDIVKECEEWEKR